LQVARYFDKIQLKDIKGVDTSVLLDLLTRDELCVSTEDIVFDLIQVESPVANLGCAGTLVNDGKRDQRGPYREKEERGTQSEV
jgi:hypothetical protein